MFCFFLSPVIVSLTGLTEVFSSVTRPLPGSHSAEIQACSMDSLASSWPSLTWPGRVTTDTQDIGPEQLGHW